MAEQQYKLSLLLLRVRIEPIWWRQTIREILSWSEVQFWTVHSTVLSGTVYRVVYTYCMYSWQCESTVSFIKKLNICWLTIHRNFCYWKFMIWIYPHLSGKLNFQTNWNLTDFLAFIAFIKWQPSLIKAKLVSISGMWAL